MDGQAKKCVMLINENIPLGIIANAAAVMGVSLGKLFPQTVGADILDKSGKCHLGIIEFPISILKGNLTLIKELLEKLNQPEFSELTVVDFSDVAQSCKTYDEYIRKMTEIPNNELNYFGIAIYGNKKQVNKFTGNMPLLK